MFGLGVPELIFILLLALLIFGPKRLPEIGRTIGRGMSEFRKASNDLKRTINVELALDEPPPAAPSQSPMIRPSRQLDTLRAARFPDGSPVPLPPDDDRPAPISPETPGEPT
ncbi:MAG TPA: twin-arginine translocase TatA/TatE family subunit [Thermoanaerobaculia bacterium]|nr:twin-arginine translocase TatA/TatE family subunit [Thermoanaerobaculia bacterium]